MNKRFLCLVLVLICMMGTALGENAYQANITLDCKQDATLVLAKQLTTEESKHESIANALVDLINGVDLQINVQENGAKIALMLKDTTLVDVSIFSNDTEFLMFSNMLPDHFVFGTVTQEEAEKSTAAVEKLMQTDWKSVFDGMSDEASNWLDGAFVSQEAGNFMGDAYEGGSRRLVFSFDDSHVSQMMDALLAIMEKQGIDDALLEAWIGIEGILSSIKAYNAEVASANQYSYTLYVVMDDKYSPIGMSLLTMKSGEQVMSTSMGFGDNGWHIVWGYGLNQENIYIDLVFIDGQNANEKDFSLTVYKDPYREGFRAVEPYLDYMQLLFSGTLGMTGDAQETSWYADVEYYGMGASEPEQWIKVDGQWNAKDETAKQTVSLYFSNAEDAEPAETIHFSLIPCEPLKPSTEGRTALDVNDSIFESAFSEILTESSTELSITLFKLIPASLWTFLMQ